MSFRRRFLFAVAYVICTVLSFPHLLAGRVVDLGVGMVWFGPAFLLLALEGFTPRRACLWATLSALVAHTVILHWIFVVTVEYGHAPALIGLLAPVLIATYVALFFSGFGVAHAWLARHGLASAFSAAALWTALEHARTHVFSGFPWAMLGYAQHENTALLGLARVTGVYGLSFVTVLGSAALFELICSVSRRERVRARTWAALASVLIAHGVGIGIRPTAEESAPSTVRVAVLQGNIAQGVKWSPDWAERTLDIYADLTRRAAAQRARIAVWPESAVPGSVEWDESARDRIETLARETGLWLVIGGVGLELDDAMRPTAYFDSAFLIDPSGALRDRYDKTHLVPFGEYVPFQDFLGLFLHGVARGMASTRVTPGLAPRVVEISLPGEVPLRVGIPICYELLFPDLVRRFAADGAQLLLPITNDAWYGRTGAPYQFLAITALRAAETGLWTARAANTGVSAFIDAGGHVRDSTPIFEPALLVTDLPLPEGPDRETFYVRHGDLFAYGCWLSSLALFAATRARSLRRPCASRADE